MVINMLLICLKFGLRSAIMFAVEFESTLQLTLKDIVDFRGSSDKQQSGRIPVYALVPLTIFPEINRPGNVWCVGCAIDI